MTSVEEPEPLTTLGEKLQLAYEEERPESERATAPVNPFSEPTETIYEAVEPATTLDDEGDAATVKSGGCVTTSVIEAVWTSEPEVPVIMSG